MDSRNATVWNKLHGWMARCSGEDVPRVNRPDNSSISLSMSSRGSSLGDAQNATDRNRGSVGRRFVGRFLLPLFGAALAVSLFTTACFGKSEEKKDEKTLVYTTFGVLENITKTIVGDKLTVKTIVPQGQLMHDYDPKPSDVKELANAKIVIANGLHLEDGWLDKALVEFKGTRVIATEGIEPILIKDDRYSGVPNPHAWVSPYDGSIYVKNIAKAIEKLDPKNKDFYAERAETLAKKLLSLNDKLKEAIAKIPASRRALVTCEGAFSYITKSAGLEEVYLWAVNSENAESSKKVGEVVDFVKKRKLPYVFCEHGVNAKFMEQVVQDSGGAAKLGGLLYVDALVDEKGNMLSYEEGIERNIELLSRTLAEGH